jgi:hypothetical protein
MENRKLEEGINGKEAAIKSLDESPERLSSTSSQSLPSDEEGLAKARRLVEIHSKFRSLHTGEMERLNLSNRSDARASTPPTEDERLAQWKENVASIAEMTANAKRRVGDYHPTIVKTPTGRLGSTSTGSFKES